MSTVAKKQRKHGRNAAYCKFYKDTNRREKNKMTKLARHLEKFPDDPIAMAAYDNCKKIVRGY